MNDHPLCQDTASRLMRYSAAAGLGAFAFGQATTDALAGIAYTDLGGIVIQRGEYAEFDVDGDGYLDFRLQNTSAGGLSGYGTLQFNTSIDPAWYGLPVIGVNPASYLQVDMTAPATNGTNAYYCRSFIDGHIIGPSGPYCWDETPTSGGRLYGLLSQYPGWDQNSFWNPSPNPGSYGYDYNEYAGLRMVDIHGDTRYAWVRFQVTIHDKANTNGFPIPDGQLTRHDFIWDTDRYVTLYDMAIEMTPDTDIVAGEKGCGCGCWDGACWGDNPCRCADLNHDCYVGLDDLDVVLTHWNEGTPPLDIYPPIDPYPIGDINCDGYVGLDDLDLFLNCWNQQGTLPAMQIPEPGCLGLLAAGAGALALRRGR